MLILTRYVGQTLVVVLPDGREVKINIGSVNGDLVRLRIDADKDIPVHRQEVYERLKESGELFTKKGHSIHEN